MCKDSGNLWVKEEVVYFSTLLQCLCTCCGNNLARICGSTWLPKDTDLRLLSMQAWSLVERNWHRQLCWWEWGKENERGHRRALSASVSPTCACAVGSPWICEDSPVLTLFFQHREVPGRRGETEKGSMDTFQSSLLDVQKFHSWEPEMKFSGCWNVSHPVTA